MKTLGLFRAGMVALAKKMGLIILALLFVVMLCAISLPLDVLRSGSLPAISIAVGYEGDETTGALLKELLGSLPFVDGLAIDSAAAAEELLREGDADVMVAIPPDIVEALVYNLPADVIVKAKEPLAGIVAYSLAEQVANVFDSVQASVYTFQDVGREVYQSDEAYRAALNALVDELMKEVLLRSRFVRVVEAADPYLLQMVAISLYLAVSAVGICLAEMVSAYKSEGYIRRLSVHGMNYFHYSAAQYAGAFIILLAMACGAWAAKALGAEVSVWRVYAAALLLGAMALPLYVLAGWCANKPATALLVSICILVATAFGGELFYPGSLGCAAARIMNPAYSAVCFARWSAGEALPLVSLLGFIPAAAAFIAAIPMWRKAL